MKRLTAVKPSAMAVNRAETTKLLSITGSFFRMIDEIDNSGQERSASEEFTVAA
ncbi:MAG: hypothetical protein IPG64_08950 [Haliea sp.]|nr:hypothetical protein [Haliea sp.]